MGSSQGPWQYDAVYAETGFHKQAHNYIPVALHAANLEIQVPYFPLYSFSLPMQTLVLLAEPPEPVCLHLRRPPVCAEQRGGRVGSV